MNKNYTKNEINAIIEENKQLKAEVSSMQKIINSRRFHFAEKIANSYNQIFPIGTSRRKALKILYSPILKAKQRKNSKNLKKLEKTIKPYKDVIVMHSIPWDTPLRQRPHHLARCLAKEGFFVIYLEPDEAIKDFRAVADNLITVKNWSTIFELQKDKNKNYYFFFNNVSNIPPDNIEKIKKSGYKLVYEYIDEFHEDISGAMINQIAIWKKLTSSLKPALTLASATKLYNHAVEHLGKKNIIMSKNAVVVEDFDYHNFKNIVAQNDLQPILAKRKPIIGYYGAISPWLNYKLISEVVAQNPEYEFVFIGVDYQGALSKLDQSPKNLHYLGPKPYNKLPIYSSFFDVAIIPFNTGEIAKGTSPVKLFEYMAMGLPTICTRDLKECEGYQHVYLAKNAQEFSKFLKICIAEHKDESVKRQLLEEAKANSWQSRAHDIKEQLTKN